MKNDKVSVIIPAYNCANCIKKSIDSILSQKVMLEIIVIDDCSKDYIDTIMQKYKGDDQLKYVKNKENLSAAQSCNRGVNLVVGEYVAFWDAFVHSVGNVLLFDSPLFHMTNNDMNIGKRITKRMFDLVIGIRC